MFAKYRLLNKLRRKSEFSSIGATLKFKNWKAEPKVKDEKWRETAYHELCMSRKQNEGMIRSSDPRDHLRLNTIIPGILSEV